MLTLLATLIVCSTPMERTLDAIHYVESRCGQDKRDGDGGKAIGPYQIHRAYWQDGTRFLRVKWPYSDARDQVKARQVVRAYLLHYFPNGTPEQWARCHNGGGRRGAKKASTLAYWQKVKAAMK
jgi:hypothetical protein